MDVDCAAGVGVFAALTAGLVSFLSPCVLPLVPGYISAVTGVAYADLDDASWQRVVGPSLLFVASFSAIFIALGLSATALGSTLRDHQSTLIKVSAATMIAMGALFVASPLIPALNREWRFDGLMARAGRGGPLVAGAAFGLAWTPCIGPNLTAILAAAACSGSQGHGAFLLAVYSAGLAIPFLLTAVAVGQMTAAFAVIKRHYGIVLAAGGAVLITTGVLIWSGEFQTLNIEVQKFLDGLGLDVSSET
jgi:cytochrome c-type biogenesis protein